MGVVMKRTRRHSATVLAIMVVAACFIIPDTVSADGPALPGDLSHVRFEGGDGTSLEQAVVILGAQKTKEGIAAENLWIKWKDEGARELEEQLSTVEERHYDVVTIELSSGAKVEIWFDITDFFGKW